MNYKQLAALILAAAMLLTACGTPDPAETKLIGYEHPVGLSITMPEGFTRIDQEGILAGYSNDAAAINVIFEEMLYDEVRSYGYDPDAISLEDYARVTAQRLGNDAQPQTDSYGNVFLRYEVENNGFHMTFFDYVHRGEAAFWLATYMCLTKQADELAPEFAQWNTTVHLPAEGVSAFSPSDPVSQSAPVRYDHPIGISLSMAEGFEIMEVEGVLAGYQGSGVGVRFAEELFASLEALGIPADMTLEEYARLILDAYGLEGEPMTDGNGNVCITYTQTVQDQQMAYYAYFSRNDVAFWTTTFMCYAEAAPYMEDAFSLWASTIELPEEAVTAPYAP